MLRPEFIEFKTSDGLTLPGLLSALARKKISTLYFNNRGAHIIKKLSVRRGEKEEALDALSNYSVDIDANLHVKIALTPVNLLLLNLGNKNILHLSDFVQPYTLAQSINATALPLRSSCFLFSAMRIL